MIRKDYLFILLCCILPEGLSKTVSAQIHDNPNTIGLTLLTLCPDASGPVAPHFLPGVQYQRHFKKFSVTAGIDYFGKHGTSDNRPHFAQTTHIYAGVEKSFFKGHFRITEGVNLVALRYNSVYYFNSEKQYYHKNDLGPAITGGFIWYITPGISLSGNLDVEFFFQGRYLNWYIPFNRIRTLSLNYSF